ncbi:hypothetical protein GCM10022381_33290 [Leifsonia kafniensis]|uniref:Uncharacterized protein n=1 Tax=Leifsonia kafniensis TaxID=475957 RepID=A0ABP7KWB1_9MICO
MNERTTYRAVLLGPNPIGAGEPVELKFVDGKHQDTIVVSVEEDGETITRTYRKGAETAEPIPYRFVDEEDSGPPNVQN